MDYVGGAGQRCLSGDVVCDDSHVAGVVVLRDDVVCCNSYAALFNLLVSRIGPVVLYMRNALSNAAS